MNSINHYKEKFCAYSNDDLKDIVVSRFRESSNEEVTAALALLRERNTDSKGNLSLDEIPYASVDVLLDITKKPDEWGKKAVSIAEAELLHREVAPIPKAKDSVVKTLFQIVITSVGIIASVIFLKSVATMALCYFVIYLVVSCLSNL